MKAQLDLTTFNDKLHTEFGKILIELCIGNHLNLLPSARVSCIWKSDIPLWSIKIAVIAT